mmetsp:Transcript_11251/g.13588  ORF Transcript_11251/g.13588 Transcript_11251/m.13588 type:complete len:222 (+) Transcript_11251:130-795(+)|eukprot:CAMPEP_0195262350 /NCGR_PEP_ID=MMETSP0706-20130129/9707_1 /TAXON_ID=33640 /ORGANISM="Asterionellopsis glacialis, Strain CCMP134" /LENGTH=221 /DNA_ID=CAMNT_0040316423 /DNA_START=408 /DNA_END=1073 /DNA_ORIENTATION=+
MEVASPLPFAPAQAGSKRPFACSPVHSPLVEMEASDEFAHQSLKRRRFNNNENVDNSAQKNDWNPFASCSASASASFGTPSHGRNPLYPTSGKRTRTEDQNHEASEDEIGNLRRVVTEQATEIEELKQNRASLESTINEVKSAHDRAVNENKILKKAVTIQQERQNHAHQELEAAGRFKTEAEDRVRRLEQMVLTLQYHLQTQNPSNTVNDFMNPRPPDVY